MEALTKKAKETQKLAGLLAKELLDYPPGSKRATVIALRGELGAGKTTFSQGFARGLGVKESVKSPTFVILKQYSIPKSKCQLSNVRYFRYFYHIDCYRLKNARDAAALDLPEIFKNPENLVLIEWPERIKKALPRTVITVKFSHINETTRKISFN